MDDVIGKVVGNYVVEELLGEGGMGAVYRGRHQTLPRLVAIKVLHRDYSSRRDITARFLQEAIAAAQVDHEHVVNVVDTGTLPDGRLCVILEYLDGRDLERKLDEVGRLGEEDALHILCETCAALSKAHSMGIVHRDLKPANIFLTAGRYGLPFVKVLDFGIAKVKASLKVTGIETGAGNMMGTPAYMAPEQAHSPDSIDARADVFAIGGVIFRMLTGRLPWESETAAGYILAKRETAAPMISSLVPGLSPIWDVAVARCLPWDASQRYRDLPSLVADLVEGIENGPSGVPDGHRIRDHAWPDFSAVAGPHAATTRARFTGPQTGGTITNAGVAITAAPRARRRGIVVVGALLGVMALVSLVVVVAASVGSGTPTAPLASDPAGALPTPRAAGAPPPIRSAPLAASSAPLSVPSLPATGRSAPAGSSPTTASSLPATGSSTPAGSSPTTASSAGSSPTTASSAGSSPTTGSATSTPPPKRATRAKHGRPSNDGDAPAFDPDRPM